MDFKYFKKVGSTKSHTIFEHPEGHVIHVAHDPLNSAMKKELHGIKMAEGGDVEAEYSRKQRDRKNEQQARMIGSYSEGGSVADEMQQAETQPYQPTADVPQVAPEPTDIPPQAQGMGPNLNTQTPTTPAANPFDQIPGYKEAMAANNRQQAAGQDLGIAEQDAYSAHAAEEQRQAKELHAGLQSKLQDIDAVTQDIKNTHIEPNHYLESMGAGQKISTAIGLLLGGIGSGLTGGENPAMKFMQSQIERDLEAQKANLGNKHNLLTALEKQYGNKVVAADMFRAIRANTLSDQIGQAMSGAKSQMALAAGQAGIASLKNQYLPAVIRANVLDQANKQVQAGGEGLNTAMVAKHAILDPKEREKGIAEAGLADKTLKAHKAAYDMVAILSKEQNPMNRIVNPLQSKQRIAAVRAELIPLIMEANPSKRLTKEAIDSEIDPFIQRVTSDKETSQSMLKGIHRLIDTHAAPTPTLEANGVPINKYKAPLEEVSVGGVRYHKIPGKGLQKIK